MGHATLLIQVAGLNLLTDPVWSRRASPVSWLGPSRLVPPGLAFDGLPPIDAVLLSHDHYDHLDRPTVDRLHGRALDDPAWLTPLGFGDWLGSRGIRRVAEMDWWEAVELASDARDDGAGVGPRVRIACLPIRHWCRRGLLSNQRLWSSWAILVDGGPRIYFGGDSGYCPAFSRIGERLGPFDVSILPIGAYEPRWFMREAHMNPEEAVRSYLDLGGRGAFLGVHWGTFRLTDEPVLEPPERLRAAWADAVLPLDRLHLPGIGGTVVIGGVDGAGD